MQTTKTLKASISGDRVIRASLWGAAAPAVRFLGPALLAVFAFGAFELESQYDASVFVLLLIAVGIFLIFLLVVGTLIIGGTNYGITLTDNGVEVYEWSLNPAWVYRRDLTWEQTESLDLPGKRGSDSVIWVGFVLFQFDAAQTRAILEDPRCPLHKNIPEDYSRRLGLKR